MYIRKRLFHTNTLRLTRKTNINCPGLTGRLSRAKQYSTILKLHILWTYIQVSLIVLVGKLKVPKYKNV